MEAGVLLELHQTSISFGKMYSKAYEVTAVLLLA